ncbi:MAG: hypothetical protein ACRC7O_18000 [Fimbriiglobus sp.]
MTLHTLSLPDDPTELPRWLERRLMAADFGEFAAELAAHFPDARGTPALSTAFDQWAPVAAELGLATVPADVLGQFLRHPHELAELQELVLTKGGPYWDEVAGSSDALTVGFERGKAALDSLLAVGSEPPTVPSERTRPSRERVYRVWASVSTGIAVCLAVAVGMQVLDSLAEPSAARVAWGWGKPTGLAADQPTPAVYLNKLADHVEEWAQERPADATGVSVRLAEFRTGCSRLMHSPYGPLADADKAWLLANCRAWAKQIDAHQQALDGGANPAAVRADVDELVQAISTALRNRVKAAGRARRALNSQKCPSV